LRPKNIFRGVAKKIASERQAQKTKALICMNPMQRKTKPNGGDSRGSKKEKR
jgi:hypothetical protein